MLTLEKLEKVSVIDNGRFVSTPVTINPAYIISIQPASGRWQTVNEVNSKPSLIPEATQIVYANGHQTETIYVLGKYENIVKRVNKRSLLHG